MIVVKIASYPNKPEHKYGEINVQDEFRQSLI